MAGCLADRVSGLAERFNRRELSFEVFYGRKLGDAHTVVVLEENARTDTGEYYGAVIGTEGEKTRIDYGALAEEDWGTEAIEFVDGTDLSEAFLLVLHTAVSNGGYRLQLETVVREGRDRLIARVSIGEYGGPSAVFGETIIARVYDGESPAPAEVTVREV